MALACFLTGTLVNTLKNNVYLTVYLLLKGYTHKPQSLNHLILFLQPRKSSFTVTSYTGAEKTEVMSQQKQVIWYIISVGVGGSFKIHAV